MNYSTYRDPHDLPSEKSWLLDVTKVAAQDYAPKVVLQHMKREEIEDEMWGGLYAKLSGYVLSEKLANDTVEDTKRVPDTWWDHAKQDLEIWARDQRSWLRRPIRWWYRRHPAKTRTITFAATWQRSALRPCSTIPINKTLGPAVYQETVRHSFF